MTQTLKKLTLLALPFLLVGGMLITFTQTSAVQPTLVTGDNVTTTLGSVTGQAATLGGSDTNVFETVGKVINVALSLLGIVFFGMVLYAGWLWMTSGGESEKAKAAQKLILNGVIGILIILSAAAISNFVISNLITAT